MSLWLYCCIRCKRDVREEAAGNKPRGDVRIICKVCCRELLDLQPREKCCEVHFVLGIYRAALREVNGVRLCGGCIADMGRWCDVCLEQKPPVYIRGEAVIDGKMYCKDHLEAVRPSPKREPLVVNNKSLAEIANEQLEVKEEKKPMAEEKCFCGREKGHKGWHKGQKQGKAVKRSVVAAAKNNGDNDVVSLLRDQLALLDTKREKFLRAIEALEE